MDNVVKINAAPAVFHAGFVARLAEANRALRQLRGFGCRVVKLQVSRTLNVPTEIVVDRNPHKLLAYCPGVHVTHQGAAA